MARGRNRSNHRRKFVIPLAVVAGFAPGVGDVISKTASGGLTAGVNALALDFMGYDRATGKMSWSGIRVGLVPALVGIMVHSFASKLGVNRALASSGVPFLRI